MELEPHFPGKSPGPKRRMQGDLRLEPLRWTPLAGKAVSQVARPAPNPPRVVKLEIRNHVFDRSWISSAGCGHSIQHLLLFPRPDKANKHKHFAF